MIDLHCHILPGLDDGAQNIEESLAMARMAVADGIRTIVATPHTLNGVYENRFPQVRNHVDHLQKILIDHDIDLKLVPGAEIHACAEMVEHVKAGDAGTVNGGGRFVLVEFPFQSLPPGWSDRLFNLGIEGFVPVVVHPERINDFQRHFELFYEMVRMGCLIQITAMSITGELGGSAMECAHRLLDLRLAHLIASDSHTPNHRPPILSDGRDAACEILGDMEEAEAMVDARPAAIVEGRSVEVPEPRRERERKWWKIW